MKKPKQQTFAHIHANINVGCVPNDTESGVLTLNEKIKAMQRFVRWHERQVVVGNEILATLTKQATTESAESAQPSEELAPAQESERSTEALAR